MQQESGTENYPKCRLPGIWGKRDGCISAVRRKSWHWYLVPLTIFLIGVLSIVMVSALHLIIKHQRANSIIIDSIMGVEVNAAVFHLGIEEIIGGDTSWNAESSLAAIDQAIALTDKLLTNGFDAEFGFFEKPLSFGDSRARFEEIKSLLIKFKQNGLLRVRNNSQSSIGAEYDNQFDEAFAAILEKAGALERIYKANRERNRQKSWNLFLSIYLAWTFVIVTATAGLWRIEMRRKKAEISLFAANKQLFSQAQELCAHREHLAELVKKRTADLTSANELLRIENAERMQAEKNLQESEMQTRQCSFRLLNAQEIERRRISSELHDGLGQALNVMKLRIRIIERELGENSATARTDCEVLLDYLDEVIDDVRRLSLDLSPAILEDLGLTHALRWLVSNFRETGDMEVTSDIAEIDGLFPESDDISIYRVVQEALTNVGKHSRAGKVSILIGRRNGEVGISVQDDGQGFDPAEQEKKNGSIKGLGLATMNERVRMMGGTFHLWSKLGAGTKITFSIPVANKGA